MYVEKLTITTTGSAGSATGTGTTREIRGALYAVKLVFNGSAPATTDTTITSILLGSTLDTLLTVSNSSTSATYAPLIAAHDNTGTATGDYVYQPLPGVTVNVAVAGCDALTAALTAYIYWLPINRVPTIEP